MDTFAYVNAAPQAALFNQGELSWLGLEDYILGHARTYAQRLSVSTAPILDPNDPPYRGTQTPGGFGRSSPGPPRCRSRRMSRGWRLPATCWTRPRSST
jgi:hypothetical protein